MQLGLIETYALGVRPPNHAVQVRWTLLAALAANLALWAAIVVAIVAVGGLLR